MADPAVCEESSDLFDEDSDIFDEENDPEEPQFIGEKTKRPCYTTWYLLLLLMMLHGLLQIFLVEKMIRIL